MAKPAARLSDPTSCPVPGHGVNPVAAGSGDVLFDSLPAARQGDPSACGSPLVGALASTVLINGRPAATVGSVGAHGNTVIAGSGSVLIGDNHAAAPFVAPAPLDIAMSYARSFAITDSETGAPLANRSFAATVNGRQQYGTTDAAGIATVRANSESDQISIHVYFQSPARQLTEFQEGA